MNLSQELLETITWENKISKKVKGITLKIDQRGLIITSRKKLKEKELLSILDKNQIWLEKHFDYLKKSGSAEFKLNHGSVVDLFGVRTTIIFRPNENRRSKHDGFEIHIFSKDDPRVELMKYLKRYSRKFLIERTNKLSIQHDFKIQKVFVRDQGTRWGSCSSKSNINLNWRLIFAPRYVTDYVIIHELSHTRELNHSANFWNLVKKLYPNYEDAKDWLKENGYKLHLY